ncbi:fumarylacetoacetate hydrolase family protein [Microbacterium telephonicum]|uniref:2-keto-4-pentenoate hydratase/2-oxohepta-3-ene-1,7-dioic acid hydratase in catechol pathway n=1 Tax=Microbacterium telephonicum TaxID=1714841 RepID=A0A498C278_9MICO|nr:fumarylacetoacetate hydrolase family protein [Microbacterium telephonicum]RLK46571.1 2-keto-4-pentenoate hydratase/2-oxohepta-3-ene-1,7-dioic acid hydratase in catechol pathway [Microbacterium telephonicum]
MTLGRLGPLGHEIPVLHHRDAVYDLRSLTVDIDGPFLAAGGAARARAAADAGELPVLENAADLRVGAPIAQPTKIVCVGLNYRDHAEETGAAIPAEPVVFMKDPSTIVGPFDEVLVPRGSTKTDWEVELGVVISETARYLDSPDEAARHIAGYVLSHDVSEREFQLERGGQWDKGKSCETFNPLGPVLVPASDVDDVQQLGLRLWVNGELRQDGSTATQIFPVAYVIWYLSQFMVLRPGDLINTGTPAGVALGLPDAPYLKAGDVVELEIDGLGRSRQEVGQA